MLIPVLVSLLILFLMMVSDCSLLDKYAEMMAIIGYYPFGQMALWVGLINIMFRYGVDAEEGICYIIVALRIDTFSGEYFLNGSN